MFNIGGSELVLILLFGFLIFGPDKMPQIARTVGRAIRQFRNAQDQMNKVIKTEVYDPLKDVEPLANPFAGFSLDGKDKKGETKPDAKASTTKTTTTKAATAKTTAAKTTPADTAGKHVKPETEETSAAKQDQSAATEDTGVKGDDASKKVVSGVVGAAAATEARKVSPEKKESFAERRARLEKEHAANETSATVGSEKDKGAKPEGGKAVTNGKPASKVTSSNIKPTEKTTIPTSDDGKGEGKGA